MAATVEQVRAAKSRQKTIRNMQVAKITQPPPPPGSKWQNQPPPEQCRSRVIEFSQSMNRPSVVVPPIKPVGWSVKTAPQPLDEALTEAEYKLLAIYVWGRIQTAGRAKRIDFESTGSSGFTSKSAYSEEQEQVMNWCAHIDTILAKEHLDMLKRIIVTCASDQQLDIKIIGKMITRSNNEQRQIGGYQGYIKAIAQIIEEQDKRYRMLSRYDKLRIISAA